MSHKPMGYVGRPKECHTNPWDMLGGQKNVTQTHGICWEAKGMSHKPMEYVGRPKECHTNPWDMLGGQRNVTQTHGICCGGPQEYQTDP